MQPTNPASCQDGNLNVVSTTPLSQQISPQMSGRDVRVIEPEQKQEQDLSTEALMLSILNEKPPGEERSLEVVRATGIEVRTAFTLLIDFNQQLQERLLHLESAFKMSEKVHEKQLNALKALSKQQLNVDKAKRVGPLPELREFWPKMMDHEELLRGHVAWHYYGVSNAQEFLYKGHPYARETDRISSAAEEEAIKISSSLNEIQGVSNQHAEMINSLNEKIKRLEALLVKKGIE